MAEPWANLEHDIGEAFVHAEASLGLDPGTLDLDMFDIEYIENYSGKKLYKQLSSEGVSDFGFGDLGGLEDDDLYEIENYREYDTWADNALDWVTDGFPAIIIVKGVPTELRNLVDEEYKNGKYEEICDGRGRSNIAVAVGAKSVPVALLVAK